MCDQSSLSNILQKVRESALRIFREKLCSIILFGSYARGDFDSDSDVDILLLVDIAEDDICMYNREIATLSGMLSLENENCTTISIIMQDKKSFEKRKMVLPFYRNIVNEGKVVYAA
jgi:predicted nucleotidyltransferase